MKRLTGTQKAIIETALRHAGAVSPCPRCGHEVASIADGYMIEFLQAQLRNIVVGGNNRLPCAVSTCDRCGFLSMHALAALGLSSSESVAS
jgi:hypothetical protein